MVGVARLPRRLPGQEAQGEKMRSRGCQSYF